MQVYILGAGASHAYRLSPTGVRPPLAKGFFHAFNDLRISGDRYVRVGQIVRYVQQTRGVDPFQFHEWNENIEDFLTEIDERLRKLTRRSAKAPVVELFALNMTHDQMLYLFESVLNEIQNGPACPVYTRFAARLEPTDVVITFNWDCLLDRVLWETSSWNPADGYCLKFRGFFDDGWRDACTNPDASSLRLLKLHGSTNWLIPYVTLDYRQGIRRFINRRIDPSSRPLFCFVRATTKYPTYEDRGRTGYEPFSYFYYPPDLPLEEIETLPADEGVVVSVIGTPDVPGFGEIKIDPTQASSMPWMVGPIRRKDYSIGGPWLDELWGAAETVLTNAARLIVIGYSFPITDTRAWQLLETAVGQRSHPLEIEIVDPYALPLADRLRHAFGSAVTVSAREMLFEDYV